MIDTVAKLNGIVQILALVLILVRAFLVVRDLTRSVTGVFFMFAIFTHLSADLYYLIHISMDKGYYPPFSAMDLAALGTYLLFGAAAHSLFPERTGERSETIVSVCAALFAAANVFLWGYYSGAWFQDIFSGITFIYLLVTSSQAVYRTGALKRDKWYILGSIWLTFVAGQVCVPILQNAGEVLAANAVEWLNYSLMFGTFLWLAAKVILCARRTEKDQALALSFGLMCWSLCTLYMCAEPFYQLALFGETVQLLLMWFIIERRVKKA